MRGSTDKPGGILVSRDRVDAEQLDVVHHHEVESARSFQHADRLQHSVEVVHTALVEVEALGIALFQRVDRLKC